jgi:hypothetical protein
MFGIVNDVIFLHRGFIHFEYIGQIETAAVNVIDLHIRFHEFTFQLLTKHHHEFIDFLAYRSFQYPEVVCRHGLDIATEHTMLDK